MCEFRENKGSKTFKIHSKGGDNFRFWQRPEKESQLSHLNCMRKSPVPCSFKNRKCLFPKRKLSAEEALPCTANSPLRTGLCIGAEARQKNALLADHAQKDCMFTVSSVRVWGGPPPCCLCSKCEVAATSSSHSHAAVATNAEAKQQRKNNGNKSYSILKFFSGSCLRENKELLPKPTLVLLQGPNMTEITPVRNFTRAMLCFQLLSWKSCRSSYVWVSFSFSVSAWQWKFSLDPAFPRSCHETAASANRNFKHSCIPACLNGISFLNLFLDS